MRSFYAPLCVILILLSCQDGERKLSSHDWREYLGGPDRNHYSALDQINAGNVKQLQVAWEYHTGDSGQIQCNAIIVDGVLYGMTASTQPFALDAKTGREIWRLRDSSAMPWYSTSRGVALWTNGGEKRLLYTKESDLYAVDALTGKPIITFGDSGRVSLKAGLGESAKEKFVISNTPGTIFEDLIVMPMRVSEGSDAAPGFIQAFDIQSGKLAWVFKTIPHPGEEGYATWSPDAYRNTTIGGANNWSGMAVDRERGILFVPTGSAAFDFYGGDRIGENLFANTLLALDARTGKKLWHYQTVHHDVLDRDMPAPPNLVTVIRDGKRVDAVAQITKQGFVFLFDRENGTPLFEIQEVPAPRSDIPGEDTWPTQPRPVKPVPFARQVLTEKDINPNASNRAELIATLRQSRSEGTFTPLSQQGTIIFPGLDGGAEWGGAAADPDGILYVNSNEMAWHISLKQEANDPNAEWIHPGAQVYASKCSSCHGVERKGNAASGFPSLVNLSDKFERDHVLRIITGGKGMMPAFTTLTIKERKTLIAFLYSDKTEAGAKKEVDATEKVTDAAKPNWKISGYTKFLDKDGYPAISPPWGTLNAIDLNTGEYRWKITYGETPELASKGLPQTGSENYGGPIVTASGLLFIAGAKDKKFRAYDKNTGVLLWETTLPAAAFATPSTYAVDGKQFIVIACGGTKLGAAKGESYVAFALP
jgi:quinoprotein glucose dehydrogenase